MTTPSRGETRGKAEGLDARLEAAYAWTTQNRRFMLSAIAVILGLSTAGVASFEIHKNRVKNAQMALAKVEDEFTRAMGVQADAFVIPEPANADVARTSREQARDGFAHVASERAGFRAGKLALLRTAQMEARLGNWAQAEARLGELREQLDKDDPAQFLALRLQGYVQEQQGDFGAAGDSYREAAKSGHDPDPARAWFAAGSSYARAGQVDDATSAFQELLGVDPEFAEKAGVLERLDAFGAASD